MYGLADNDERNVIQAGAEYDGALVGFAPTGEVRSPRAGEFFTAGVGNVFQANVDYKSTSFTILSPVSDEDELIRVEVGFTVEVLGQELPVGDLIALRDTLNSLPLDDLAAAETALSA